MLNRGESPRPRSRREKSHLHSFLPIHCAPHSSWQWIFFSVHFFPASIPLLGRAWSSKVNYLIEVPWEGGAELLSFLILRNNREKKKKSKILLCGEAKKPCNFTEFVHPSSTRGPAKTAVKLVGRLVRGVFWWKTEEVFTFSLILAALHLSQKGSNLIITHVLHAIFFIFCEFISLLVVTRQEQKYKNNKNNISTTEKWRRSREAKSLIIKM